jgi:hypothetical protein
MAIDLERFNFVNRIINAVDQGVFKSHEIEHFRTWKYYVRAEAEIQSIKETGTMKEGGRTRQRQRSVE